MNLFEKLSSDVTNALKKKDNVRVSTLRFVISAIKNAQIAKGEILTEVEVQAEIAKDAKRHKESVEAYRKAAREELAKKEEAELEILQEYLPQDIGKEELEKIISEIIEGMGGQDLSSAGIVMKAVMAKVGTRADGSRVREIVNIKLAPKKV